MVHPRAAMNGDQRRTLNRRRSPGDNRRSGYVEPEGYVTETDPHWVSPLTDAMKEAVSRLYVYKNARPG
jgi:hypothetical protein